VPSEAFFATTAQVLPALLIAFALEAGLLLRDPMEGWRRRIRVDFASMYKALGEDDGPMFDEWVQRFTDGEIKDLRRVLFLVARVILGMITVGEIGATWALFVGQGDAPFTLYAGITCLLTMTFSTIIVAVVPVVRLRLEVGRK
jgi:hypothetical protein